jgi:hypothetical protein
VPVIAASCRKSLFDKSANPFQFDDRLTPAASSSFQQIKFTVAFWPVHYLGGDKEQ